MTEEESKRQGMEHAVFGFAFSLTVVIREGLILFRCAPGSRLHLPLNCEIHTKLKYSHTLFK